MTSKNPNLHQKQPDTRQTEPWEQHNGETQIKNDKLDSISHLSNATIGNSQTISTLAARNSVLDKQLIDKNEKLVVALEKPATRGAGHKNITVSTVYKEETNYPKTAHAENKDTKMK